MDSSSTSHPVTTILRASLMAMPGLFLLHLYRFDLIIPTNLLEVVTGVLAIVWLYRIWTKKLPRPTLIKGKRWISIGVFLFAITLAAVLSGTMAAWGIWKGWFMAPFVYFLMLISTFRTEKDVMHLIEVSVGLMAISAAAMLWQYWVGSFGDVQATYDQRLVWPFVNYETGEPLSANYVALLLSPFLCLGISLFSKAKGHLDKVYTGLSVLALVSAVFFTKSYGAWAALLGTLLLSAVLLWDIKKWLKVSIPLLVIVLGLGLYFTQQDSLKFAFFYENSIGERLKIWEVTSDMIADSPVLGVGPGAYQEQYALQFPDTFDREPTEAEVANALHPHNIFLMFWVSEGVLGFLSILFLWGVYLVALPKKWRWILLPPFIYLFFHGLIDVFYWKNDLAYQFWFLIGLVHILAQQRSLSGKIAHGLKVGRELGFPTANIQLDTTLDKEYGVYVVSLKIEKIKKRGLLYYGPRKTKGLPENIVCEITIFDFDEEVYGKTIQFNIESYIRGPMEFEDPELLKEQIQKDVLIAKNLKI